MSVSNNEVGKVYHRPWGCYQTLALESGFQVKILTVSPGGRLSLQRHFQRSEHWVVVSGVANAMCGDKKMVLQESESIFIPKGELHQLGNTSDNNSDSLLEVIEVQVGESLGEHDIERV